MLFKTMSDFFVHFLIQQQINVTLRDNSAFMCFSAAPAIPLLYFVAPCFFFCPGQMRERRGCVQSSAGDLCCAQGLLSGVVPKGTLNYHCG